jgi:hypothetical protein
VVGGALAERGVNVALVPTSNLIAFRFAANAEWACVYLWGRPGSGLIRFRATQDPELGRLLLERMGNSEMSAKGITAPGSGWAIFVRRSAVTPQELAAATRLYTSKYAQGPWPAGTMGWR